MYRPILYKTDAGPSQTLLDPSGHFPDPAGVPWDSYDTPTGGRLASWPAGWISEYRAKPSWLGPELPELIWYPQAILSYLIIYSLVDKHDRFPTPVLGTEAHCREPSNVEPIFMFFYVLLPTVYSALPLYWHVLSQEHYRHCI